MNWQIEQDINWLMDYANLRKFYGKKILITGASGFIPRYFVYLFMELNRKKNAQCKIYALVRSKKAVEFFDEYVHSQLFNIQVGNVEACGEYAKGMNYIFHGASISNSKRFMINPVEVASANVIGTYEILNAIKNEKCLEGFIYFSSGAVYGNTHGVAHHLKESEYFAIDCLEVKNCYAESKKMGEIFCYSFYKEYEVPIKILRIGHTYGPGIDLQDGHVYSDFVKSIVEGKNLEILGNPHCVRPFTYILDTVSGILKVALSGKNGEAYNLCNMYSLFSIKELAEMLVDSIFASQHLGIDYAKDATENLVCQQEIKKIGLDVNKIEKLGWTPQIDIEEGFRRTVKSFLDLDEIASVKNKC